MNIVYCMYTLKLLEPKARTLTYKSKKNRKVK